MRPVLPPETGDDWLALTADELPVAEAYDWAVRPGCGAVVLFTGTVRDHADGRDGVEHLAYEAYEEPSSPALADDRGRGPPPLADDRARRPAPPHRPPRGRRIVGDRGRVGARTAPRRSRPARFAIDALKASVADLEARDLGRRRRLGHRRAQPDRPTAVGTVVVISSSSSASSSS